MAIFFPSCFHFVLTHAIRICCDRADFEHTSSEDSFETVVSTFFLYLYLNNVES